MLDLIIKNGQCYIDGELKDVDVAVIDGKIHKIGEISEEAKDVINAEGQTVLPGCIDTQTHFREPGSTDTWRRRRGALGDPLDQGDQLRRRWDVVARRGDVLG